MGKKAKIGKSRRDRFYQLAKETGYRSRAAFKLLQLNRKYEFLQKSRVCIDLCAAPGGWLQVAAQHTPVSSIVIGVDLVPIKAIHNVVTIQEDITTAKCRQRLKKELQTWKADIVLHDGAPNVGKNWIQDAFLQAQLTLSALKLATEFLMKGGWFVTKVFRSKDYHALLWIFQQLFKKVYATKPQASRAESAEIFVVCQYYLAPDKIDPKFLDPKYVFADVDLEPQATKLNLNHPEKQSKKAQGYPEGDYTLYHRVNVSEFVRRMNHVELLNKCSELVIDEDVIAYHPLTTTEIRECCRDIKVLGRKELKSLLLWRKHIRDSIGLNPKDAEKVEEVDVEENEDEKIQKEIEELQMEEVRDMKLKKKKVLKERRKLRDKMNLKMVLPNAEPVVEQDDSLFRLSVIRSRPQLEALADFVEDSEPDPGDNYGIAPLPQYVTYDKDEPIEDDFCVKKDPYDVESDSDNEKGIDGLGEEGSGEDEAGNDTEFAADAGEDGGNNPLVLDLDYSSPMEKTHRKMNIWFSKESFAGLESDDDEDLEMELVTQKMNLNGSVKQNRNNKGIRSVKQENKNDDTGTSEIVDEGHSDGDEDDDDDDDDESGSDYDVDAEFSSANVQKATRKSKKDGFHVVPVGKTARPNKKRVRKTLDPEGLALGALLIKSKKTKRDITDLAWNRYTNNDEELPDWFLEHEKKHYRPNLPVTKEMVSEYRDRLKEINARPIKKVVEAKSRKKRRALRKMEKARKKAENVVENLDMTDKEKSQQIKAIYKKAGVVDQSKKKELSYVVSKKALAGKRVRRPPGVKGRFRVVDPRQKKDDHKRKSMEKESKRRNLSKSKQTKLKKRLATMSSRKQRKPAKSN